MQMKSAMLTATMYVWPFRRIRPLISNNYLCNPNDSLEVYTPSYLLEVYTPFYFCTTPAIYLIKDKLKLHINLLLLLTVVRNILDTTLHIIRNILLTIYLLFSPVIFEIISCGL